MAGRLDDLVRQHVTRALGSGREHSTTWLGEISPANAQAVRERTGIDIAGFRRVIQSSDIRHVFRSHGDAAREQARGQVAIVKGDLLLITTIVADAQTIRAIGRPGAAKPLRLEYGVTIAEHAYRYVEEVRPGIVALKSMLKIAR